MSLEDRLNLNGEFLGVTALAVYSAPWYLQIPLLVIVGALFYSKVAQDSGSFRRELTELGGTEEEDQYLELLNQLNRFFFGFRVAKKDLPAYWLGFLIFLVTFVYAVVNTLGKVL